MRKLAARHSPPSMSQTATLARSQRRRLEERESAPRAAAGGKWQPPEVLLPFSAETQRYGDRMRRGDRDDLLFDSSAVVRRYASTGDRLSAPRAQRVTNPSRRRCRMYWLSGDGRRPAPIVGVR